MAIFITTKKRTAVLAIAPSHVIRCNDCSIFPSVTTLHGKTIVVRCGNCFKDVSSQDRGDAVTRWNTANRKSK